MSLIRCKECNGQVSDQAYCCPHCGIVLNPAKGELATYIIRRLKVARLFCVVAIVISFFFIFDHHPRNVDTGWTVFIIAVIGIVVSSLKISFRSSQADKNKDLTQ